MRQPEQPFQGHAHYPAGWVANCGVERARTTRKRFVCPGTAFHAPLTGDFVVPSETSLLVNATSVGLGDPDAPLPISVDSLRPELIVADVVFNPPETWLLRTAADHGCRTLDGLGMLVNQAVISFRIWTDQDPDATVIRDALEEFLEI